MTFNNNDIKGKIVVVTGASGYIGSSLIVKLKKYSAKIIRISRKKLSPEDGVEDWLMDLNNLDNWMKIVSNADIIFHLAGNTSIYNAEKNPQESLMSTVLPITHLISASKTLFLSPKVVFASTVTIYGLTNKEPVDESTAPNPITLYDMHKYFAEQLIVMACKNSIIDASILRLANVYGPSLNETMADDRGVLSKLTRMALEGKDLNIYGGGSYIRDYVYITDVISAFICVCSKNSKDIIFNVSTETGTKVIDVFNLISQEVQKTAFVQNKVVVSNWPIEVNEIEKRNFIGSNQLLKSVSNWSPSVEIGDGIKQLVSYFAKEYKK
tara:strand:- start:56 stop:1030 length:975 start_codon:yes stop_codon:yes gene_type:complete